MTEQAVELDELPQIDVDRAFAVLSWDVEEVLRGARSFATGGSLSPDAAVQGVVRERELVGWERGWTLAGPSGRVRCAVRALFAFPGRLWLLVDGVPVLELKRDELALAMRGLSLALADAAVAAVRSALGD